MNAVLTDLAQGPVEALFKGLIKYDSPIGAPRKMVEFADASQREGDDEEEEEEDEEGAVERVDGEYNKLAMSLRRGAAELLGDIDNDDNEDDDRDVEDADTSAKQSSRGISEVAAEKDFSQNSSGDMCDRLEGSKADDSIRSERSVATIPQRHSSIAPSKGAVEMRRYQSKHEEDAEAVDEEDGFAAGQDEEDDYADDDYEAEIIESPMPRSKAGRGRP